MAASEIEAMIKAALPDAVVEITDLAGDGDHYSARVTETFALKDGGQAIAKMAARQAIGKLVVTL